jgi:hypothetical protein
VRLRFITARAQDPGRLQLAQKALDQRRLADAGFTLDDDDVRAPTGCLDECIAKRPELVLPAHEDGARGDGHGSNSYHQGIARR